MADFDSFENSAPQQTEDDPAADFLAREQDELKGLEDDNFGESAPAGGEADDFDPFGGAGQPEGGSPQPEADSTPAEPEQKDAYSAVSQVDKQRAEPEKIRLWREENTRRIQKKDEEESKRMDEWRDIAKKELDDWYKHHEEQLTKTKENNRNGPESEAAFVAERDQTQPGEEWEKICRLCEFNPKNSKNTKDISRMRQILLQLKQTPLVR